MQEKDTHVAHREANIQATETELRSHPQETRRLRGRHIPPKWVTYVEVPYKEDRVRELDKKAFDFGWDEGVPRSKQREHTV